MGSRNARVGMNDNSGRSVRQVVEQAFYDVGRGLNSLLPRSPVVWSVWLALHVAILVWFVVTSARGPVTGFLESRKIWGWVSLPSLLTIGYVRYAYLRWRDRRRAGSD